MGALLRIVATSLICCGFIRLHRRPRPQRYIFSDREHSWFETYCCLDARTTPAALYDCAEPFSLRLTKKSLHLCSDCGVRDEFSFFEDVHVVCLAQQTSAKKRRRPRKSKTFSTGGANSQPKGIN